MTIHQQIKEKLTNRSQEDILKKMGYHNLEMGRKTLWKFLDSEDIYHWIKGGNFDMKYGSEAFLERLIEVLELSNEGFEEEIQISKERHNRISEMKSPYIYIDTHFKRQNEPIFALAMMEGKRRIRIDKEWIADMGQEEVFENIKKMIIEHYKICNGELPLWGRIYNYIYHHTDGSRYVFDTQGNLEKAANEITESKAELKIGNNEITNLIGGK